MTLRRRTPPQRSRQPAAGRLTLLREGTWAIVLATFVAAAGCTGGGGALSLNKATLDEPDFTLDPPKGDANTVFKVDALGLGDKYNVTWDWGDGKLTYGGTSEHKYGFTNGVMTVTLLVTDGSEQGIARKTLTLGSGENKAPAVSARAQRAWIAVGQQTNLTATGSDGDRDPLTYLWTWRADGGAAETALAGTGNRVPISFEEPGKYQVKVRARDPKGGEAVANFTMDVSKSIPASRLEQTFNGTIVAGAGGAGVSEKAWTEGVPDTAVDAVRHRYTLLYPANTLIFLMWNDTTGQGVMDLDLELRSADGTTVFKSETRAPAAPFEFNVTQQEPGDYDIIVRGVVGANVPYTLLLQATLQLTPERVAAVEGSG